MKWGGDLRAETTCGAKKFATAAENSRRGVTERFTAYHSHYALNIMTGSRNFRVTSIRALFLALVLVLASAASRTGFVRAVGGKFSDDGGIFRYAGTNVYYGGCSFAHTPSSGLRPSCHSPWDSAPPMTQPTGT